MNIVSRAKGIMLNPVKEWDTIKHESLSVKDLFTGYAIFLAIVPAVAGFIGYSFLGVTFKLSVGTGITYLVLTYIMSLISVFVLGYVIDLLAASVGSSKDLSSSMKVAVFSTTPAWVFGVFNLSSSLSFIPALAALYSLVLLYLGLKIVKASNKVVVYFVVVLMIFVVLYFIASAVMGIFLFGNMVSSIQ